MPLEIKPQSVPPSASIAINKYKESSFFKVTVHGFVDQIRALLKQNYYLFDKHAHGLELHPQTSKAYEAHMGPDYIHAELKVLHEHILEELYLLAYQLQHDMITSAIAPEEKIKDSSKKYVLSEHHAQLVKSFREDIFERKSLQRTYFDLIAKDPKSFLRAQYDLLPELSGEIEVKKTEMAFALLVNSEEDFHIVHEFFAAQVQEDDFVHFHTKEKAVELSAKIVVPMGELRDMLQIINVERAEREGIDIAKLLVHEDQHMKNQILFSETYKEKFTLEEIGEGKVGYEARRALKDELLALYAEAAHGHDRDTYLLSYNPVYGKQMARAQQECYKREYILRDLQMQKMKPSTVLVEEHKKWNKALEQLEREYVRFYEEAEKYMMLAKKVIKEKGAIGLQILAITPLEYWDML